MVATWLRIGVGGHRRVHVVVYVVHRRWVIVVAVRRCSLVAVVT